MLMDRRQRAHSLTTLLRRGILRALLYIVLVCGATIILMPLAWMVSASFKSNDQIFTIPVQWIPRTFHFDNFSSAIGALPVGRWFINSAIVATCVTIANLILASLAGYGFAKFNFFGKRYMFMFVLATLMVPLQVTMVPLFIVVREFNWIDTYQGLIVPVMTDAFGVFLMRQFMLGIPTDYIEAARVDGASEPQIYWHVILPMSSAALSALGILTFMGNWDEFLWPLIVVSGADLQTIPLGLESMQGIYQTNYNQLMAVATLSMLPLVAVFLLLKHRLMEGISISGVKL